MVVVLGGFLEYCRTLLLYHIKLMPLAYFIVLYGKIDTVFFPSLMIKSCWPWGPNHPFVAAKGFGSCLFF